MRQKKLKQLRKLTGFKPSEAKYSMNKTKEFTQEYKDKQGETQVYKRARFQIVNTAKTQYNKAKKTGLVVNN